MSARRGFRGDNVIFRRTSNGESIAVNLTGGQGDAPAAPTAVGSATGGTLPAATYAYKNTYVKDGVESPPSPVSNSYVASGATSSVALTVVTVAGATAYKIYGRTGGSFLLMNTITAPTVLYTDTNADTPSGAAPAVDFNASFRTPYSGHALTTGVLPGIGAGQYQKTN